MAALGLIEPRQRPLLAVAGARTDREHLRRVVAERGLRDDVRLLGFVSPEQRDGLYRLASGVIVPSLYEGFGLPALEAMAYGTPLACSEIAPLREVTGDTAVSFPPRDHAAMARAMLALLDDREASHHRSQRARARAATFTWRATAQATLMSYETAFTAFRQRRAAPRGRKQADAAD